MPSPTTAMSWNIDPLGDGSASNSAKPASAARNSVTIGRRAAASSTRTLATGIDRSGDAGSV